LRLAAKRLAAMGFDVQVDEAALARHQRFAGDDDVRLAALHRIAKQAPSIAMATRGGYGLTRLLDASTGSCSVTASSTARDGWATAT